MQTITKILIFCIGVFLCNIQAQAAFFQGLGDPSLAEDISLDGSNVVGLRISGYTEAFLWTQEDGMVGLGDLSGGDFYSKAYGVSADGSIVVGFSRSGSGREAFLWTQYDGMDGLGDLPGGDFDSIAYDVSANGSTVVGFSRSGSGREAFLWTQYDGMVGLGDLPGGVSDSIAFGVSADGSIVVGSSVSHSGGEAFLWTQEDGMVGLGDLPGGAFSSYAHGVSANGSTVVGYSWSGLGHEAFIWTQEDGMVGLGDLPGGDFDSIAFGVSATKSTVVGIGSSNYGREAFIWDSTNGMRSLKEVLINEYGLDLTGWTLNAAYGVSGNGKRIVGVGKNPDGNDEAWIADIGEGIRVYGEFSGYIDDLYGPQAFLDEINIGTRFNCNFSYDPDMPMVWYWYDEPIYADWSFSTGCTFFGNTQEHHLNGNLADHVTVNNGTTDNFSFGYIWNWDGLLAGYEVTEGGLSLTDSTGTAFDDDSIPTSLDLGDFDMSFFGVIPHGNIGDGWTLFEVYGTLDSLTAHPDYCPNDPNKIDPGVCGCGIPDTDSDGDGTFDCVDDCPNDPGKTDPGTCGCGVADVDTDTDGTFDCNDNCPNDPNKIDPGVCGCGIPDSDSDGDGILDCNDDCDNSIDTDGDGLSDCDDLCPNDPNKTQPGTCGCGVADTDTDSDGTLDCNDDCPNDPSKIQPGTCGCGVADTDTDLDGTPDCTDGCPNDINKSQPGICGCGIPDTDSDGDGIPDCNDGCDNSIDSDADGLNDCDDLCPNDPNKTVPGTCGCGIADSDSDGDGTLDCMDVNDDGDGLPDGEEQGPDRNNPNYDGNGDGIADYLQGNVASFHTYNDQNYITIASPSGTTIRNCKAVNKPSSPNSPQNVDFPHGFFGFDIDDLSPGDAATATMYFPAGESFNTYYRYGPTPDNPINHWYEFLHEGQTGANINGNVITLHFVDGIRGDDDLTTNGTISDIGAPGLIIDSGESGDSGSQVVTSSGGGSGGCFISTAM